MKIADLYDSVTQSIIRELEQGTVPWLKPWKTGKRAGIMPVNVASGRHYRGINIPLLWSAADAHGYPTNGWITFRQALQHGGNVRKGEKATNIVFTKKLSVVEDDDETRQVSMLRAYAIFNVAQTEGIEELSVTPAPPPEGAVTDFIASTGADIRHGSGNACYVPSLDFVSVPNVCDFVSPEHYYATALHELTHWTGHKSRLDRDLKNRFGTRAYAAEELVAELGAAFLCAHLGVKGELRHASYIESWLSLLKEDSRAVFTAAAKASQAADYLRSFTEKLEEAA